MRKRSNLYRLANYRNIILLAIIIFALIRLINLDADPGIFKRIGDISDEGYWAYEARNLILYQEYITDELTLGSALAPLNVGFAFIFFKLFGVSSYTLRLTSAIFGILTILLAYLLLRKYNAKVALWGTLFLALNYNFFLYNRIGHPETLVSFFILLTFFLFENRKFWFLGGLSYGLAVCSKTIAIYFFPAIVLYFIFRVIRSEIRAKNIFQFVSGGLVIAVALLGYQYYFADLFRPTYQEMTLTHLPSVKDFLLQLPGSIATMYLSLYLVNPINILLVISFVIYLWQIQFVRIFSKNFVSYVKSLNGLDIVIISWVFGYVASLLLAGQFWDDRRLQLLSVVLSFIPAVIIFGSNRLKYYPETNMFQMFIRLIPFVFAGNAFGKYVFPFAHGALAGTLLSLAAVILLSVMRNYLTRNVKLVLVGISMACLLLVLNFQMGFYLGSFFQLNRLSTILIILVSAGVVGLFAYYAWRTPNFVKLIYAVSLIFIIINLATPQFSVRNASEELSQFTSKNDYVIGIRGHMLSYNAEYHPIWWFPNPKIYGIINSEFVKRVKPQYLLLRTELYGNKLDLETQKTMPPKVAMEHIGASELEEIYSFSLFPVFGRYGEKHVLYKIIY